MTDGDRSTAPEREIMMTWLASLPPNADVAWCSRHIKVERPYGTNYVDVNIPEFEEIFGWGWSFTIVEPDDEDTGELVLHVPYDMSDPCAPDTVTSLPGWSTECISIALATWVRDNVGRNDIYFGWNPNAGPSRLERVATVALEEMKGNPDGVTLIGVTNSGTEVYAVSGVMDFLLALPEEDREIITGGTMKAFNDMAKEGLDG